jgi:hypothetical protein
MMAQMRYIANDCSVLMTYVGELALMHDLPRHLPQILQPPHRTPQVYYPFDISTTSTIVKLIPITLQHLVKLALLI